MGVTIRHQLPASSPVSFRAVVAALGAGIGGVSASRRDGLAEMIREALRADHAILTDSGTTALTLALRAAVAGDGPVALPAYGCYDLATACDGADVRVLLYDVEPDTLGPDPDSVRAALNGGARAVVTAPPFGFTTNTAEVRGLCSEAGVPMIEDIAQCLGAETAHGAAGTLGDYVVLSFGRGKGVTAGRGGALVSRGAAAWAPDAISSPDGLTGRWRDAAGLLALWTFGRPALFGIPARVPALRIGETVYHRPRPGRAMGDVGVAVLVHSWRDAEADVGRRRRNAARLSDAAGRLRDGRMCRPTDGSRPSFLRFPLLVSAADRARAGRPAARRIGLMPGYPRLLGDLPGFGARCVSATSPHRGARELVESLITAPTHAQLREADLRHVFAWLGAG